MDWFYGSIILEIHFLLELLFSLVYSVEFILLL